MGYYRAGFDVVGVDIKPQPRYPFRFVQADALNPPFRLEDFDAIHASPPCQDHMRTPLPQAKKHGTGWMLAAMRESLTTAGIPFVIENVPGAPMRADFRLCGCMFNLEARGWELRRLRWFETSWPVAFYLSPPCRHEKLAVSVVGNGQPSWHRQRWTKGANGKPDYRLFRTVCNEAMGIDWMKRDELSQAIPPAFTEFIGRQLIQAIQSDGVA